MARVSIYVSDELKARMAEVGDALNWSDIARPAFEAAIADFNHRRGRSMTTAIERLKASKQHYLENTTKYGAEAGRDWAQNTASFYELKQVSQIELSHYERDASDISWAIHRATDPDDINRHDDIPEILFGERTWPTEEWMVAWVRGAQEFFQEVENQL
jgi:predicted transcriptional regulator